MRKAKKRDQNVNGFSHRLRELRKQKNLSQNELGVKAGIHFTHISQYERGLSLPAMDTLKRLATALEVTADYLMEGKADEAARVSFEDREFLNMFKELENLPDEDKIVIKRLIEAFLTRQKIQKMVTA
ncbi:MAG: helix-turn-helix transcriptional regulator [Anaerolineaceae bacterium]|nr:helix-turn-helix transcriptional regulator [Anaerolineaceae bacterium]